MMRNRFFINIGLLAAVLLAVSGCRELARQPDGAVFLRGSADWPSPDSFYGSAGDWSVTPKWYFTQWNSPQNLMGSQTVNPGQPWMIANQYSRLQYIPSTKAYEIGTNNQSSDVPCHLELSNFLSPVNESYSSYPQGLSNSSPLNELEVLGFQLGLEQIYSNVVNRCSEVNYGSQMIGLTLRNITSSQVFFYQIIFKDTRGYTPNGSWCPVANLANPDWFCMNDHINATYGFPVVSVGGGRHFYQVDALNRIKAAIQSGHTNNTGTPIDTNLSHWELNGVYMGNLTHGGANATSRWDSFCLAEKRIGEEYTEECI